MLFDVRVQVVGPNFRFALSGDEKPLRTLGDSKPQIFWDHTSSYVFIGEEVPTEKRNFLFLDKRGRREAVIDHFWPERSLNYPFHF